MDALRSGVANRWRSWNCHAGQLAVFLVVLSCAVGRPVNSAAADPGTGAPAGTAKVERPVVDKVGIERAATDPVAETEESLLAWLVRSLGAQFAMIFLFLTVALLALMVVNVLAVRRDSIVPPALILGLEHRLSEDRFQEACELVRTDSSILARVLAAGLPQLSTGGDKAAAAMAECGSLESIKVHSRLGYVWLIAQLAPLFGLLGTVNGLIAAFEVIVRKGTVPRPIDLAGGIGTALVATVVGLWIAILAVAFHQIVLSRVNRLLAEAGILAERFAERLAAAKKA
jgi:biopolymer transport protein ExbB